MDLLEREAPELDIRPGKEAGVIHLAGGVVNLDSVYSEFLRFEDRSEATDYVHHFVKSVTQAASDSSALPERWEDAREVVRLQLVSTYRLAAIGEQLEEARISEPVSFHVTADLHALAVLDMEGAYAYLQVDEIQDWPVTQSNLFDLGLANLSVATTSTAWRMWETGPNRLMTVRADDDYQAARILLPEVREFLASHLDEPFRFAVSDRSSLTAWSREADDGFQRGFARAIAVDFETVGYPISPGVYEATRDAIHGRVEPH